jgi:hypothetical protein
MAASHSAFQRRASTRRALRHGRGSKQRLKRITMRGHSSTAFWIFVVGILLILFVAVPWFATHPTRHEHHAK